MIQIKNVRQTEIEMGFSGSNLINAWISTTEETFQSHIIDSTIFQTNSFDDLNQKRRSNKNLKIFVSFKQI